MSIETLLMNVNDIKSNLNCKFQERSSSKVPSTHLCIPHDEDAV